MSGKSSRLPRRLCFLQVHAPGGAFAELLIQKALFHFRVLVGRPVECRKLKAEGEFTPGSPLRHISVPRADFSDGGGASTRSGGCRAQEAREAFARHGGLGTKKAHFVSIRTGVPVSVFNDLGALLIVSCIE